MQNVDKQSTLPLDSLLAAIEATARDLRLPLGNLAEEVHRLSEAYRDATWNTSGPGVLAAKLAFWLPRDVAKYYAACFELLRFGRIPQRPTMRVLDLGAGLGAAHRGLMLLLGAAGFEGSLDVTAVDSNSDVLATLEALVRRAPKEAGVTLQLTTKEGSIDRPMRGTFDVIFLGQVLCEWLSENSPEDAVQLVTRLTKQNLTEQGVVVIVEPALRARARSLQELRGALIAKGLSIQAPCLHEASCPLLTREGDWCHEDWPIDLPLALRPIAKNAGLRWEGLTFSYLVVSRKGVRLSESLDSKSLLRLVSSRIKTKGKTELFVCGEQAKHARLTRLDREASPANQLLDELHRGDWIEIAPPADDTEYEARGRILKATQITRRFPEKD